MFYTLAYLFRKPSLTRQEFSTYYERHHTHLAQRLLPEFSHYRRNHVLESTDDSQCPDSFSEFGYDRESKLAETRSILGDQRGRELLDDELKFMDKIRNRIYPVTPLAGIAATASLNKSAMCKYIVVARAETPVADAWLTTWRALDSTLNNTTIYADFGTGGARLCWLMGWSEQLQPLDKLQAALIDRGVPLAWCARVDERCGYPIPL